MVRDLTGARLPLRFPSDRPRHRSSISDNYCAQFVAGEVSPVCVTGQVNCVVTGVEEILNSVSVAGKDCHCVMGNLKTRTHLPVFCHVANHVSFAGGLQQKKGVNPEHQRSIKSVKGVFCVNQSSSVQNVTNVQPVVPNLPVGARLHQFWKKWAAIGVSPKVPAVLREGYILPFRFQPNLTRTPTITSCYVNPHRNSYLLEALHQLLDKNAVELVQNPQSLGFYNQLFLVPEPNNRWHRPQVDLFATRFNNKLPQFVSPVPDPQAWAVDALSLSWDGLDPYAFPPAAILGKVVEKLLDYPCSRIILIAPGWPNMPWFWDLVAMSSQTPLCLPSLPNLVTQPDPTQKSVKSQPPCLAPSATAIKDQGFSEAVAARIEATQRRSTRSVYEAKWTIFTKWCLSNQVDVRAPPLKAIADFLLFLFQDRKLQPGTIDGYRSAIADKLGNSPTNISTDENLTRLLDSFHRDRPKGRRGIPSWNLSLVLHQLTKAPFEPLKEASLKHLTFKTVFLLALGSGKHRSEIHAWLHKNIRHQAEWSKVSLYPSPSFLSKNQLAKEGPDSVAPVVIPALAPTLDKSLKGDRSLCPVRALRYYLDRTSDLRQNKELVFVSFKKGFDKDISPATVSSWIKQTVILCYELSDQQALTLHQVKAHDVRAFAASKAFQSGISLDQILSACHWKSHYTFTQFYLKDVA